MCEWIRVQALQKWLAAAKGSSSTEHRMLFDCVIAECELFTVWTHQWQLFSAE